MLAAALPHPPGDSAKYEPKELASADYSISQGSRENFAVASEMEKSGEEEEEEDIFSYREEKEATV